MVAPDGQNREGMAGGRSLAIVAAGLSPAGAHRLAAGQVWLLKGDPGQVQVPVTTQTPANRRRGRRIRCPRCSWEPAPHDRWVCACLHAWNTFETRGVCPECGRRWAETQCLSCTLWSPHDDWYDDQPESPA
jgi:hypothetical protein